MPHRLHRILFALTAAMAVLVGYGCVRGGEFSAPSPSIPSSPSVPTSPPVIELPAAATATNALVLRVVDGDTLDARLDEDGKEWRIRLLGINTPETVDPRRPVECFGKEASSRLNELVGGKRVRLEADPQADERDAYGRLLRNLTSEDGTDVNASMVRDGYAYAYLSFPLDPARKKELKNLQEDAKIAGRGLWSQATCNGSK